MPKIADKWHWINLTTIFQPHQVPVPAKSAPAGRGAKDSGCSGSGKLSTETGNREMASDTNGKKIKQRKKIQKITQKVIKSEILIM